MFLAAYTLGKWPPDIKISTNVMNYYPHFSVKFTSSPFCLTFRNNLTQSLALFYIWKKMVCLRQHSHSFPVMETKHLFVFCNDRGNNWPPLEQPMLKQSADIITQ